MKKFAVPCEPSWGSQLALPRLTLGGATGSGTGLFLEADGGKSGWFGVVVLSESAGLESPRLDYVSSLEVSLMETCEKGRVSKHKHVCKDK